METQKVRINISVPKELLMAIDRMAGKRKRSRFIAEAVRERIESVKTERLATLMAEGYRKNRQETLDLAAEFAAADLENWDEY
jgi:metal-responsive CopG/Arc/MetJ family transcriptional regulator